MIDLVEQKSTYLKHAADFQQRHWRFIIMTRKGIRGKKYLWHFYVCLLASQPASVLYEYTQASRRGRRLSNGIVEEILVSNCLRADGYT